MVTPVFEADQHAVAQLLQGWPFWLVADGQAVHDNRALGVGQQDVAHTEQGAGRHFVDKFGDAFGAGKLFFEGGAALAEFHLDGTDVFGRDFDDNFFDWLHGLAVFFLGNYLRAADFEFIAFAAHGFDQHAEVEFAAASDRKADAVFFDVQTDIGFEFFLQTFGDLAGGVKFTFLALERAGVWAEVDPQRRGFDFDRSAELRVVQRRR